MTAKEASEAAKGLTFEDVWAALVEMRNQINEIKKQIEEMAKQIKEMDEKIDEKSNNINEFDNYIEPFTKIPFCFGLYEKFGQLGYSFNQQAQNKKYTDGKKEIANTGLVFENDEYMMMVLEIEPEVKHPPLNV